MIWSSIIVPTTYLQPFNLPTAKMIRESGLLHKGVELIVVRDVWRNANRARNVGIAAASGDIICVMDDDINLNIEVLHRLLSNMANVNAGFYINLDPHFIIARKEALLRVGGYDERFKPCMGDDVELMLRLQRAGYKKLDPPIDDLEVLHLQAPRDRRDRYLLNQKHLTWAYLEYRKLPVYRLFLRKNPIEAARRLMWILEWLLYRRWISRSIFTR
ncbi:MAG: glycosyltransferase [Candidatus Methanomethylicaceae archaeon]